MHSARLPSARALAFLAGLPIAIAANAVTTNWTNPVGGSAAIGTNWNTGSSPTAADAAIFALNATYTVAFPATVASTQQLATGNGVVTFNFTAPHTTTLFRVGTAANLASDLTIASGTLTVVQPNTAVGIGMFAGTGSGTLTLNNSGTVLRTTLSNGDIVVGSNGEGTLNVSNGARAESSDDVVVGSLAGSGGSVIVGGSGLSGPATLTTTSTTSGDVIVGDFGSGRMTVRNSGVLDIGHDLILAQNTGSDGAMSVITSGTASVSGDLLIGRNLSASAAGTASLQLSSSAVVSVRGATTVGDPDGGSASLDVQSGSFTTHDLVFTPAQSTLAFSGGTIEVRGGVFTPLPGSFIMGSATGSTPLLRLSSGTVGAVTSSLVVSATANSAGRLEILSGASLNVADSTSLCGVGASGGSASALLDGAGSSLSTVNTLTVANVGTGLLDITGGAHAQAGALFAGTGPGAVGTINLSDLATSVDAGIFALGGTTTVPGGTGLLNLTSSGTLHVAGQGVVHPGSTLNIDHATLDSTGPLALNGALTLSGGVLNAASMTVANSTVINASGRINAAISNGSVFGAALTLTGALDVGPSGSGSVSWAGQLGVGAQALTVRSPGFTARLGDVTIAGGSISTFAPSQSTTLANGDSLNGFGTLNCNLQVNGGATVTATGTGLVFNGLVTPSISPAISMSGSKVTFGATGGLTASGSISAAVLNNGAITATGDLQLGDGSPLGAAISGSLNVGPHHVTLRDSNGGPVGQCTMGGGSLELIGTFSGRNLSTTLSSHLKGFGTLTAPFFYNLNGGQISPGNPGATGTGALNFTGDYLSSLSGNTPGTLNIDIRDPESIDQLTIAGSATLGGTLNVTLLNGFRPAPGTRMTFIHAASVTGTFATLNVPPGSVVLYDTGNTADILFPCPSDFNTDGSVDFFDYLDFVDAFAANDPRADINGDASIDFFDYLDFVDAFSSGC